jgi:tetraacyldisaccharide-1-P 4'-kinase
MGLQVREELYFPDHHRLSSGEITQIRKALAQLRSGSLLVTEKDWGRWRELFAAGVPALVIQVRFAFRGRGPEELEAVLEEVKKGAGCFTLP